MDESAKGEKGKTSTTQVADSIGDQTTREPVKGGGDVGAEKHSRGEKRNVEGPVYDSWSGAEDEVPIVQDSGRREQERTTSNESKGAPLSTARKQPREEKPQGPPEAKKDTRWETISAEITPEIQSTKAKERIPSSQKAMGNRRAYSFVNHSDTTDRTSLQCVSPSLKPRR